MPQVLFARVELSNLSLYLNLGEGEWEWRGGVSYGSDLCSKCAIMLLLLTWGLICQIEEFQE